MPDQSEVKSYNQVVAKAWSDPAFKEQLLSNPAGLLRDEGMVVSDGMQIRILEPSETRAYLTLPVAVPAVAPETAIEHLTVRALTDADFKSHLVADPKAALAESGVTVPDGVQVEVVAGSDTQGYLMLPAPPDGLDLESLDDDVVGYLCTVPVLLPIILGGSGAASVAGAVAAPAAIGLAVAGVQAPQSKPLQAVNQFNPVHRLTTIHAVRTHVL